MKGSRPLTDSEIKRVLNKMTGKYANRNRALLIIGCKTGFRVSELLSLKIKDVLQHGKIVDRVTVQKKNMKKKIESRTVILNPLAKRVLKAWIDKLATLCDLTGDVFLFVSQKGLWKPIKKAISRVQAWQVLRDAYEKCQLIGKLGTHAMRKTFADRIYKRLKCDLVKTQKALGHKNINSTVAYLSFVESDVEDAILAI